MSSYLRSSTESISANKKLKRIKELSDEYKMKLRLPIIIQSNPKVKNKGNFNVFEKYLDLKFLPFFPMISPGHI